MMVYLWSFGLSLGHLVYFTAIWYILWPSGIFIVIWYIFSRFGMLFKEKSGNPGFGPRLLIKLGCRGAQEGSKSLKAKSISGNE
jgi:hypothetical protein